MIVFGEAHLRRILGACAAYYNELRTHPSLNKDAPFQRAIHSNETVVLSVQLSTSTVPHIGQKAAGGK
jgi:hypothetical protein